MKDTPRETLTSSHWGTYRVEVDGGKLTGVHPFSEDADPSPIGESYLDVLDGPLRIKAPMVRKAWLRDGPGGAGRGEGAFIELSWEEVIPLVARELTRVRNTHGNKAIFAGSYGWASAGRFHHAQSQLKRFLNCIGGFTGSRNTYSFAAAEVVVPHVIGNFFECIEETTPWSSVATHCELFVAFGGVPLKNGQISQGGTGAHEQRAGLASAQAAGVHFVNVSPQRSDLPGTSTEWMALRPGTDTALILALCHTLIAEELHDRDFVARCSVGFAPFRKYLFGEGDGIAKDADWAAGICGLQADKILGLARRMAAQRTMISTAWALTRQDHGEQPFWAAIALATLLGQIGQPGTGIGFGYSAMNYMGGARIRAPFAALPQGENPIRDFIPVARIAEMLEAPGAQYRYDGETRAYPDARLVWWAGGNPFHHHQDLNRLRRAWRRPETVIANEWCLNSLARHADIVLPVTTTLERRDLALTPKDAYAVVMDKVVEPMGEALSDHAIFRALAAEMGVEHAFTEGRSEEEWLAHLYSASKSRCAARGIALPSWEDFNLQGWFKLPEPDTPTIFLEDFVKDPARHPLKTPSGKIELFSETVAAFGDADCPGHPFWMPPAEWLGAAANDELHLLSNQPANKLHSQLDHGRVSARDKVGGRDVATLHPAEAARRRLADGDTIRLFNTRGACHAALRLSEDVMEGVIQMATGAWFAPDGETCLHGNPNVLTRDAGTSSLAQGPSANSCLVRVEKAEDLPDFVLQPPVIQPRDRET